MDNNRRVVELPLDDVLPNRFQPRIKFNEEAIDELCESIKEHGVIQPIVVRAVGDRYEIIAGERRYKAATLAGLKTIPAIITDLNDKDSAEVALIENVQRQDLTPIEEAISYKKILDMGYLTQDDLAKKLGKNQSTVANKLRLLNLDEDVQEALLNGKISERHARSLLKLRDERAQVEMLNKIINERLTVRKTDEEIEKMLNSNNSNNIELNNDINKAVEVLDFDEPVIIPAEEISGLNIPTAPIIEPAVNIATPQPEPVISAFDIPSPIVGQTDSQEVELPKFSDLLEKQEETSETSMQEDLDSPIFEASPEISQSKFFNILDEVQPEEQPASSSNSFDLSNFGFPNIDDSAFTQSQENNTELITESVDDNNTYASDMKTVINTIRNCAETIEKYGFKIDTEEFDLEDMYQVIFKISKK